MHAVVIHAPHDLRIDPVETADPGRGEVRVRIESGGICGSDLHFYHDGRIGQIVLREPMILGHEVAGRIEALGAGVTGLKVGQRVAVSPSRACGHCAYCQAGQQIHCLDMRFYGSAMRMPHVQGAFRESIVADAAQCHVVSDTVSAGEAAMSEPLAVCLHAARRAGSLLGKRVLVTGSGPIGALCVVVARQAGAAFVMATDVAEGPRKTIERLGADRFVNVALEADQLAEYARDKGTFDVLLEASGNEKAIAQAFDLLKPRSVAVLIGLGGAMTLPMNVAVAKELELRGTFRFHEEFAQAVALIGSGRVDLKPLISATMPYAKAREAFDLASDRSRAMKVQLTFA